MLRLFVGIEFPPELKLWLLQSGIGGARWIDPGNFHLTLRFIGEVDEGTAADVDEALLRLTGRPFSVQLAGVGIFGAEKAAHAVGRRRARAGARDAARQDRAGRSAPDCRPKPRKFAPHVTLARLRDPRRASCRNISRRTRTRAAPLRVDLFSLIARPFDQGRLGPVKTRPKPRLRTDDIGSASVKPAPARSGECPDRT